jgi:hypothetical protein
MHSILHTSGGKGYGGKILLHDTSIHSILYTLGGKGYGDRIINVWYTNYIYI